MPYNKPIKLAYRGGEIDVRCSQHQPFTKTGRSDSASSAAEMLSQEQQLSSTAMLLNCYVLHGGAYVICMPVRVESETQALIQLWDGVQFRVPRDHLRPLTRVPSVTRCSPTKDAQQYTAAMYGHQPDAGRSPKDGDLRARVWCFRRMPRCWSSLAVGS